MGEELTDDKRSGSDPGSTANDGQEELNLEYWLDRISCNHTNDSELKMFTVY